MKKHSSTRGFTLIELILGMTILTVIMGSIFMTMKVGMDAYRQGRYTMEVYQSGRIALQKISDELQLALSSYSFSQLRDTYSTLPVEELLMQFKGIPVQEEDPGAIRFIGSGNSITYVRKVYHLNQYPPFDLEECSIFVENGRLTLSVLRSLLEIKQATWFFQHIFQVNLNGVVAPGMGGRMRFRAQGEFGEPPLQEWLGDVGFRDHRYTIAEGIQKIDFRFSDDGRWKTSWDSQELETTNRISSQSPNFNQNTDTRITEKGPPKIVEITIVLENNDILSTATDIPAGNMRASAFGVAKPPPPEPKPATNLSSRFNNETPAAVPGS
jgi:prepilin-type N-terminal cleavage/methylation domain-containing protein